MTIRIKLYENNGLIKEYDNEYEFKRDTQASYFNEWECESDLYKEKIQYVNFPRTIEECKQFLENFCDKKVKIAEYKIVTVDFTVELIELSDYKQFKEELSNAIVNNTTKIIDYNIK